MELYLRQNVLNSDIEILNKCIDVNYITEVLKDN